MSPRNIHILSCSWDSGSSLSTKIVPFLVGHVKRCQYFSIAQVIRRVPSANPSGLPHLLSQLREYTCKNAYFFVDLVVFAVDSYISRSK